MTWTLWIKHISADVAACVHRTWKSLYGTRKIKVKIKHLHRHIKMTLCSFNIYFLPYAITYKCFLACFFLTVLWCINILNEAINKTLVCLILNIFFALRHQKNLFSLKHTVKWWMYIFRCDAGNVVRLPSCSCYLNSFYK